MIKDWSDSWLRAGAVIIGAFTAATFTLFFCVPTAYANCCTCTAEETYNYGAEESKTSNPGIFVGAVQYFCGNTAFSGVTNSDPNDFTVSYPSNLPGPSCNGFAWNSGNQGAICYFQVSFSPQATSLNPQGTGAYNSTVTLNVTNGNGPNVLQAYGAGFTLSTETHDKNSKGLPVDSFSLMYESPPSPGFGSITFDPGNAEITWSGQLDYQTSGEDPKKPARIPIATFTANQAPYVIGFGTPGAESTPNASYPIAGGQLTLQSNYSAPASAPTPVVNNPATNAITGYLTGIPSSDSAPGISYQAITTQLTNLYQTLIVPHTDPNFVISGVTTPTLLTQVAMQESANKYQQFRNPPTVGQTFYPYSIADSWPLESHSTKSPPSVRGSHIGLLQVAVVQQDAWNWLQNTIDGFGVFQGTMNTAYRLADDEYNNYTAAGTPTTLPALTACQLEEMALALYGPYGGRLESQQYLIPKCAGGTVTNTTHCSGTWQWTINNPKGHTKVIKKERAAVCYVVCVRMKVHPSPPTGSASMCTGTSPLPDPPAGLSCGC
jgi:hypothetical protein